MIGIVFALPSESADLRRRISVEQRDHDLLLGKIDNREVALIHTGVGARNCNERLEILRGRWMNAKQNNAGLSQRRVALNCNLPEVLVQRKHDPRFDFREIQQGRVLPSG